MPLSTSPPLAAAASFSNMTPTPVGELLPSMRPLRTVALAERQIESESSVHEVSSLTHEKVSFTRLYGHLSPDVRFMGFSGVKNGKSLERRLGS